MRTALIPSWLNKRATLWPVTGISGCVGDASTYMLFCLFADSYFYLTDYLSVSCSEGKLEGWGRRRGHRADSKKIPNLKRTALPELLCSLPKSQGAQVPRLDLPGALCSMCRPGRGRRGMSPPYHACVQGGDITVCKKRGVLPRDQRKALRSEHESWLLRCG